MHKFLACDQQFITFSKSYFVGKICIEMFIFNNLWLILDPKFSQFDRE